MTMVTRVVKFIRQGAKGNDGRNIIVADTYRRNFTTAQWATYGAVGHSKNWVQIANIADFKIGDAVVIVGTDTDLNIEMQLYANVTAIDESTATLTATTYSLISGGPEGPKGDRGPALRGPQAWSDCAVGYSFQAGGAGEAWKDVVIYGNNYYSCVKSHTKAPSNYPGSTTANNKGYWQLGDKIELVATKILLATYALVQNLGVEAIDMKDGNGNILFQAKDGNVTCKTGTFDNITVLGNSTFKGSLEGVSGSFKQLNCVNNSGSVVGGILFGDGKMTLEGDLYNQGYDSTKVRGYRFYSSDIWCRGQFGAAERSVLEVKGTYGYYYTKGVANSGTYVAFTEKTSSINEKYYELQCYGQSNDYAGMPVDIIVFNSTGTEKNYELVMFDSQRVLVVNTNDDKNNVQIYSNGGKVRWNGGEIAEVVKLAKFATPAISATTLGRGLFVCAFRDNNW